MLIDAIKRRYNHLDVDLYKKIFFSIFRVKKIFIAQFKHSKL